MAELVRVAGTDGEVLFEGALSRAAMHEIGADERIEDYIAGVEANSSAIGSAITTVVDAVRESFAGMATDKADGGVLSGLEVGFGLKVSGEGRMFVAKAGAEVNLSVKISWDFS